MVLQAQILDVVLEGLDGVALVLLLPADGADQRLRVALLVQAYEVQLLALVGFAYRAVLVVDPVVGQHPPSQDFMYRL